MLSSRRWGANEESPDFTGFAGCAADRALWFGACGGSVRRVADKCAAASAAGRLRLDRILRRRAYRLCAGIGKLVVGARRGSRPERLAGFFQRLQLVDRQRQLPARLPGRLRLYACLT